MAEKVQEHDFIELDYTGKLADGSVFDTTVEEMAKKNDLFSEKMKYGPIAICVGEKQVLPGLDEELVGKDLGESYTINIPKEKAFGKRDIKKMQIVPMSTFSDHKVDPQPGLQVDVDGERGIVSRVSGGRVIVNFNHPLAGRDVIYEVKVIRKIVGKNEQIAAFLNTTLKIPKDKLKIEIKEDKATVEMPMVLPEQFTSALGEKLAELVKLKGIEFKSSEGK